MSRSEQSVDVEYNRELEHLERLMSAVDRPGSYVASGAIEAHMPSLSIEGVGRVAFPVLPSQAKKIVAVSPQGLRLTRA